MAIKRNGVYVIQKEINVLDILEELCEAIEKADAKKVGYVTLTHGTANDIRDFFLDMEQKANWETEGTAQNPTSDTERNEYMPRCFGDFGVAMCGYCEHQKECYKIYEMKGAGKREG